MRNPTTAAAALRWHNQALSDKALHLDIEVDYDEPQPGWYLTRMTRGGPFVPARIFLEQEVGDDGELLSDEILRCEINGTLHDPHEAWMWMCHEPIDQAAYDYLMARKNYAEMWAPQEPAANPFKKTDWGKVPMPTFTGEARP